MHICIVGSGTRFLSGISYYTNGLSNALAVHNTVSVVLMRQLIPTFLYPGRTRVGQKLTDQIFRDDISVFDGIDWYWLPTMLRAIGFLGQKRPDVIVLQWWTGAVLHSYLMLALIARLMGIRLIIEFHEIQDPGEARLPLAQQYVRMLIGFLIQSADGIVVHSNFDYEALTKVYNIGNLPYACSMHAPLDQYQTSNHTHAQRDVPLDICNLLFFGTIRPYKGLEDLIRAFDSLDPEVVKKYWLTIVGEPWEGWTLPLDLIAQSRYKDRITLVARYVTDREAGDYFAGADLVVLPYHRSSASGPLAITMNWGLPVILTSVGGLVEAGADYAGVIFVPPHSPEALHDAIIKGIDWRGKRFDSPHSWQQTCQMYETLLERLNYVPEPVV